MPMAVDAPAPVARPSPSRAVCAAAIRRADAKPTASGVPAACWGIGPVAIGMTRQAAQGRLGRPDFADTARLDAGAGQPPPDGEDVYLFPRDLAARLARAPGDGFTYRLLVLVYRGGSLSQIDTAPNSAVDSGRCPDGRPAPAPRDDAGEPPPADFAPFLSFAGVRVGDTPGRLQRKLGRADVNTSQDLYTFDPAPLRVDVEPGVRGFAVSADRGVMFAGYAPGIVLHRRAGSCRIDGFSFVPVGPGRSPLAQGRRGRQAG